MPNLPQPQQGQQQRQPQPEANSLHHDGATLSPSTESNENSNMHMNMKPQAQRKDDGQDDHDGACTAITDNDVSTITTSTDYDNANNGPPSVNVDGGEIKNSSCSVGDNVSQGQVNEVSAVAPPAPSGMEQQIQKLERQLSMNLDDVSNDASADQDQEQRAVMTTRAKSSAIEQLDITAPAEEKEDEDTAVVAFSNETSLPETVAATAAVVQEPSTRRSSPWSDLGPGAYRVHGPDYSGEGSVPPAPSTANAITGGGADYDHRRLSFDTEVGHVVPEAYAVPPSDEADEENVEIAQAEHVKPFFLRREGQLTIVVVGGLIACMAILLGVFLTRSQEGTTEGGPGLEDQITTVPSTAPSFDPRSTLAIVRDRGAVNCGIEDASNEGAVNLAEYNIDQCRALASTIFGNPTRMNLILVSQDDRYKRLVGRELDVLFAGDAFTLERSVREPTIGEPVLFGYPYYGALVIYLGLAQYIQCVNEQKRYDECKDLSICAVDTPEIRSVITSSFPASFITFGTFPLMETSLKNGTCNVLVSDTYRIYGSIGLQNDIADGRYVFSDYYISRNLLAGVVRVDDWEWFDIVQGSTHVAQRATQLGIYTSKGDDYETQCTSNVTNDEISFFDVPRCVGNSVERFQSHLGNTIVSFYPGYAKLPSIDAPTFGSLECDDCQDYLKKDGILKTINERGFINCAVFLDPLHNLTMSSLATIVNVQFCKMVSVAIFQGKVDAVNITFIDEMIGFPREFDIVAGAVWGYNFNANIFGTMIPCMPYYYHEKHQFNGTEYGGSGLALSYGLDTASGSLAAVANAIVIATIYAQRQGITRANHFDMPLIHLFGNSLTFMFRDVIMYSGNYDDIIDEAIAASDGAIMEKGWNAVVPSFDKAPKIEGRIEPVYFCDYSGSCIEPCEWKQDSGFFVCQNP